MGPTEEKKVSVPAKKIRAITEELDREFLQIFSRELSELERLNRFTESVNKKIKQYYRDFFPKKCNTCETVFATHEDYMQATESLPANDIFDAAGLQEYRNCLCGSTLIIWTEGDRRDHSDYGEARRRLYEDCLAKLKKISSKPENELKDQLREIFSLLSS